MLLLLACQPKPEGPLDDTAVDTSPETADTEDSASETAGRDSPVDTDTRRDSTPDTRDTTPDSDTHPEDTAPTLSGTYAAADATVRITGGEANTDLGRIVRVADVDGDDVDDLVTATFMADARQGGACAFMGPVTTSGVADDVGACLTGGVTGGGAGRALAVGDLDGDGIGDIGLGAPYDGNTNGLYVAYGPVTDSSLADAALLAGPRSSYAGHGADIGDVNADGIDDAVVGAYYAGRPSGTTYVSFGPITGELDLAADADAALIGESGDVYAGRVIRVGGDLDGDGTGDLVIACLGTMGAPGSGGFYVVYGPPTDLDLSLADGRYAGATASDTAGLWMDTGDLDGDGLDDIVVGSYDDTLATTAGAAFVVLGPGGANTDLSAAELAFHGDTAGQYGGGVDLGDLDGDGVMELLLGAQGDPAMGVNAGAVYLFLDPVAGSYVFGDADAVFQAEGAGDNFGAGSVIGDVDADGVADIVIGAPYQDSDAAGAGAVYVF